MSRLPCPVEECTKDYATQETLDKHVAEKHPNYKPPVITTVPASPEGAGEGEGAGSKKDTSNQDETKKIEKVKNPEEPDSPDKGDTGPNLEAENERLRKQLEELQAKYAEEVTPVATVKAISDKELIPLVKKCAKILWERNKCLEQASRRKKDADFDAYDELLKKAHELEKQAVPIAAQVACVNVKDIFSKIKRGPMGEEISHGYGINVRDGALRIVLHNALRLKVDIQNVNRAKWDYAHDQGKKGMRVANRRPDGWKGRTTIPIMRS